MTRLLRIAILAPAAVVAYGAAWAVGCLALGRYLRNPGR